MILVHGYHAGTGPADEGRVGEAESEVGSQVPDQGSALQSKDPGVDAAAVEAEDAREMESRILCFWGHWSVKQEVEKTSGVSFWGDGMLGGEGELLVQQTRSN